MSQKHRYTLMARPGLPASKIGTFPQTLYNEAKSKGWIVISMKSDRNRIFAFEK